jgi:hypothetical protein
MNKILILLVISLFLLPSLGLAGTYWVSPTGTASWANCSGSTPLSGTSACSLSAANNNAAAGDLVYLRGGTYSYTSTYATAFYPSNSGSSGNLITFRAYPGETPELACSGSCLTRGWGMEITNKRYIKIDGLTFTGFSDELIRASSDHLEITNCTFQDGGGFYMVEDCGGGSAYNCPVSHIWIHGNTFLRNAKGGGCSGGSISEGGDVIRIGYPPGTCGTGGLNCTGGANNHITIENNVVAWAGHTGFDSYGQYNVIKDNYFHNEPWYAADNGACSVAFPATNYTNSSYNGKYSHRSFHMDDSFNRDGTFNLIEGNRFGHAGVNPNNDGADSLDLGAPKNIVRYNSIFNAMNSGLMFKWGGPGPSGSGGINNNVYNNTIYHNGYGYPFAETCVYSVCPWRLAGIRFYYGETTSGNKIKNNIVYDNRSYTKYGADILDNGHNRIEHNWVTSNGDPKFVNPDLTDPTSRILPNLNLQSSSPAIDGGTYLTQANGAGSNSTTLIVDDALYFQDGTWGSSLAGHLADWIAIGTVTNVVQISSINYTTNTISLKSPMTWSDNANIWLYKKSDGTPVLHGSAPDFGAHESSNPAPPANLRVLQ